MSEGMDAGLRALPAGARIALVAPASPPRPENIDAAVRLLRDWGYDPVEMPHLRSAHPRLPYLAGTDEERAADVMDSLCDERIDAVMCARGGYGSARILPLLGVAALRAAVPKPFFGSSDITALHDWLLEQLGWRTWFSPMPATNAVLRDATAASMLRRALVHGYPPTPVESGTPQPVTAPVRVHGRLRGGNLSLMAARTSMRTDARAAKFTEPTILLIEDVHEKPYHIDEMLRQLVAAGWCANVAGIALGSWLGCAYPDDSDAQVATPRIIKRIAHDVFDPLAIPIAMRLPFGHGPAAHTLPLGVEATLGIGPDRASLSFDS